MRAHILSGFLSFIVLLFVTGHANAMQCKSSRGGLFGDLEAAVDSSCWHQHGGTRVGPVETSPVDVRGYSYSTVHCENFRPDTLSWDFWMSVVIECSGVNEFYLDLSDIFADDQGMGEACHAGSNPINLINGNKYKIHEDISDTYGSGPLTRPGFERIYNSRMFTDDNHVIGLNWRHSYQRYLGQFDALYFKSHGGGTNPEQSSIYSSQQSACVDGYNELATSIALRSSETSAQMQTVLDGQADWSGVACIIRDGKGRYKASIPVRTNSRGYGDILPYAYRARLYRPNGDEYVFTRDAFVTYPGNKVEVIWSPETLNLRGTLLESRIEVPSPANPDYMIEVPIYIYTDENDVRETYNKEGKLITIKYLNGVTESLFYEDELLDRVENNLGDSLYFSYYPDGKLSMVTDDADRSWQYFYDDENRLEKVVNADDTEKNYHYENILQKHALTGLTDERGIRYSTFVYNPNGLAESSYLGPPGAGPEFKIDNITMSYDTKFNSMTDSRGNNWKYHFSTDVIQDMLTQYDGPECNNCSGGSASFVYDIDADNPGNSTLNLTEKITYGVQTLYPEYDNKGNPKQVIEAVGEPDERLRSYEYDARYQDKITKITEPSVAVNALKTTSFEYDDFGNITSLIIDGFKPDGSPVNRSYGFEYNGPFHQLTMIDGPLANKDDRFSIEYYPDSVLQGNNRARMKRITAPLGLLMFDNINYTPTGKVESYITANNLFVFLSYYPGNGRLEKLTRTDIGTGLKRTTLWTYLPTGEVESITIGHGTNDATVVTLGYDDARRLTHIYDGLGNYIKYTLDTEGNVIDESIYDAANVLRKTLTQTFDDYNRLDFSAQVNESLDLDFSPNATLDLSTDSKGAVTDYGYDSLLRLTLIEQDKSGDDPATADALTRLRYDDQDNLTTVIDPNEGATSYVYDDLGNLLSMESPDTGLTTLTYDDAGNVATMTDAKNQFFEYSYDALGRIEEIYAPGIESDVSYSYDTCSNGAGLVCSISKSTTLLSYAYNAFGDVETMTQTIESLPGLQVVNTQLTYDYDNAGRISVVTYPTGNQITTTYDEAGNAFSMTLNNGEIDLVTRSTYHPFGGLYTQVKGDGLGQWHIVDQAYRTQLKGDGNVFYESISQYDGNGNPVYISQVNDTNAHHYDALDRLDLSIGSYGLLDYSYDKVGNRRKLVENGTTTEYDYKPSSNRMKSAGGQSVELDANGNTKSLRGNTLVYTSDNRLREITGVSEYIYNGKGERVMKATNRGGAVSFYNNYKTLFVYGINGKLLAEYGPTGQVIKEYIYFNNELLAILDYKPAGNENILKADMDDDGAIGWEDYFVWYYEHYLTGNASAEVTGDGVMDINDANAVSACALDDHCVTSSYDRSDYYAYNNHLGTPQALTDKTGTKVWSALYKPFGKASVNEDVDGDGKTIEINIRFPGQYYDAESGLHYNYYRTYDPETGRYITSDPIGLLAGMNTYGYVMLNPLRYTDMYGLICLSSNDIKLISSFVGGAAGGFVLAAYVSGGNPLVALGGALVGGATSVATTAITESLGANTGNSVVTSSTLNAISDVSVATGWGAALSVTVAAGAQASGASPQASSIVSNVAGGAVVGLGVGATGVGAVSGSISALATIGTADLLDRINDCDDPCN